MSDPAEPITHTTEQSWELLGSREFGRLAYHLTDEVHIVPVNYIVDRGRIIFRTTEGSKLLGVVMDSDVAFEVDEVDHEAGTAWSVIGRGRAEILEGNAARAADTLPLHPWVADDKVIIVAITVTEISGRTFRLLR